MPKKLEGKIAAITGGTEGIGLATGKLFVKERAYVFITGRRQKELDEAVKAIASNVSGVQGDVAKLSPRPTASSTTTNSCADLKLRERSRRQNGILIGC
jgi:NAD(P)-dependent dehydrogenase (short-subunit alcohol dehydrogenase family)